MKYLIALVYAILIIGSGACKTTSGNNSPDENGQVEKIWVVTEPVQCQGNPWESAGYPGGYSIQKEGKYLRDYFGGMGVTVYDVKSEKKYEFVCEACNCPRGDALYLLVDKNQEKLMGEKGFKNPGK